jgi:hypothetical protein
MKAFFIAVTSVVFAAGTIALAQPTLHVTLEAKPLPAMKAGAAQAMKIFFHPKKGIHINLDPAIDITIEKNPITPSTGRITASKDAHGYLNPAKPVLFSFAPVSDAKKGTHMLKVKVVYFLCSDAEGWCNRDEQTLDVPVTVK